MSTLKIKNTEPTLRDLLTYWRREIFLNLNCHGIATVQSVNTSVSPIHPIQTVTCEMNYTKSYTNSLPNGEVEERTTNYATLIDCPFIVLGGSLGVASLTFPILPGDQCLILFNDRDLDNWVLGARANAGAPNTNRLHSFSDAIALIGLNPITSYDNTRAVLSNGLAMVGVGPALIKIANNLTTLKTCLDNITEVTSDLITQLTAAFSSPTQTPGNPIFPGWAAAIAPVLVELTNANLTIAELLE